jgi:sulfur-carrier protein adenylyltransferase/sulfurtransferase
MRAEELARYNRQLLLPEFGTQGQERLLKARVLVVGAGGLGSPVALYLAAAGVGTLGIVDHDRVGISNLHRQILHGSSDVGRDKTASAGAAIMRLNPHVRVEEHQARLEAGTAERLITGYDLVVDGSDNYPTRYAINDACSALGVPWVYGSVERYSGQVSVFGFADGPCYRCLYPQPPAPGESPSCDEIGVLGAVPGVVGALQATEALKVLAGVGEPLSGRLLQMDLLRGATRWVRFDRRADCPACGRSRAQTSPMTKSMPHELPPFNIEPKEVPQRLRLPPAARLLDVREPWEVQRASLADATVMPMSSIEQRVDSLDPSEELIVFCHHGQRSQMVTDWLRSQGFRARNMVGGIDKWSREVDAAVPRY